MRGLVSSRPLIYVNLGDVVMNFIDLVSFIKSFHPKAVDRCVVYGRINKVVPRPGNIFDSVKTSESGVFVEVQVLAVNLGYYKSYLKQNGVNDTVFMVNGSLITFVESGIAIPEWYELRGTLRFGTKDISNTYVGLLTYFKGSQGWEIRPSYVNDLEMEVLPDSIKFYMEKSVMMGRVVVPDNVLAMPAFTYKVGHYTPPAKVENPVTASGVAQFKCENRNTVLPMPDIYEKFRDKLSKAETARLSFMKDIVCEYGESVDDIISTVCINLMENLTRTNGRRISTGRAILKGYLTNFRGSGKKYIGRDTVADYLVKVFNEIALYIFDHNRSVTVDGAAWEICKQAFGDKELFFAGIVAEVTGVSFSEMRDAYLQLDAIGLKISSVLVKSPYILQFVTTLSFNDIEKLAICFNRHLDKELDWVRNIAILNDFINDRSNGSTLFTKTDLSKQALGIRLTRSKYKALDDYGSFIPVLTRGNVDTYLGTAKDWGYPLSSFEQCGSCEYVKRLKLSELMLAIKDYDAVGLGLVLGEYVTSTILLRKELFIFETMWKMASRTHDYALSKIDTLINEYEQNIGFTLEHMQREAVHLAIHDGFIVAGIAGSGKTTVSNCIVYVLEHLEPDLQLKFAAPTGKAAKRMQEVVRKQVKTMHSEFMLGVSDLDSDMKAIRGSTVYFFDESAMISLDLMYMCLKSIDVDTCRVFMFGDIGQLSPIGKGLPFKNLLRFMPCVFLNVAKRAAENCGIVRNGAHLYSDMEPLEETDDFKLIECGGQAIPTTVYNICSYYLGKTVIDSLPTIENITPDDIQVVVPISKDTYNWGAKKLNELLQPLFNPGRGYKDTFVVQASQNTKGTHFSIGDRVIHTDKNMYGMQWYTQTGNGVFQKVYGYGICNGEVGKIVGIFERDDVSIEPEMEDKPIDFTYPEYIRDDNNYSGENKYFVAVQYYDYIDARNIIILYRAELDTYINSNQGVVLKGDDLSKLNLFYAGTTHKLQGSEAKVVICPLDYVNFNGFITREMVYTMFTRGKVLDIGVGSVGNSPNSMLSKARRDLATKNVLTVGEVLFK